MRRAKEKDPASLDAWECAHRGWGHIQQGTRKDNEKARSFLRKAIELDPDYAEAFAWLALTHYLDIVLQTTDSVQQSIAEMQRAAQAAVERSPDSVTVQITLGWYHMVTGQRGKAIAAFERAIQVNPSNPHAYAHLGLCVALAGSSDEAIAKIQTAIRLSPRDYEMHIFFHAMGLAHFVAGRFEEAAEWSQRGVERKPTNAYHHAVVAASHAHLGRMSEAQVALEEALRLQPGLCEDSVRLTYAVAAPSFLDRLIEGLRKAGMKE